VPIPIEAIPKATDPQTVALLRSFPGISFTDTTVRVSQSRPEIFVGTVGNTHFPECCSLLYSTTTYDGVDGIEKENNAILKGTSGGSLVVRDSDGSLIRTIIEVSRTDGKDVQL
jgi:cell division protein FtsI/penicillin-binding protein 2